MLKVLYVILVAFFVFKIRIKFRSNQLKIYDYNKHNHNKIGGGGRKKAYKYILTVIFPLCNSSKPYCFCSYITNIRNITFNYFIPHLLFIHVKVMSSHTVVGLFSTKKKLKKNFLNTCCISCSFLSRHLSANTYTSYKLLRQTDKQGNLTFHSTIFLGK